MPPPGPARGAGEEALQAPGSALSMNQLILTLLFQVLHQGTMESPGQRWGVLVKCGGLGSLRELLPYNLDLK